MWRVGEGNPTKNSKTNKRGADYYLELESTFMKLNLILKMLRIEIVLALELTKNQNVMK